MQTQTAVSQIRERLGGISDLYNRLILLVGPAKSGKTRILRELAATENASLLNVGLEVSKQLLDLTERQRTLQLPEILENALIGPRSELAVLDNIEVLFNPALRQDPLRLLKGLSRSRNIVSSWSGSLDDGNLIYAVPEHPEFRRDVAKDVLIVPIGNEHEQNLSGRNT
ncbi:MAG: BREX-3 system P-loop-containing protein BrxF [Bryobacteraceae bacterium]